MTQSKNKVLAFIIAVLLLANIATLIYFIGYKGPYGRGNRGDRSGGMSEFLKKDIGFNEQQLKAFDSLKQQHRSAMRPLFEALGRSKDSLYQLLSYPSVSDSAVDAAAMNVGKRQAEIETRFFHNFSAIRSLCTEEQKPKFDSLVPAAIRKMMMPPRKTGPPEHENKIPTKS